MKKRIKERWLKALRSGKYKQGRRRLRIEEDEGCSYCCLGVLTDLYIKSKAGKEVNAHWVENAGDVTHPSDCNKDQTCSGFIVGEDGPMTEQAVLPKEVSDWAGVNEGCPLIGKSKVGAISANDGGKSFKQIANMIEKHVE